MHLKATLGGCALIAFACLIGYFMCRLDEPKVRANIGLESRLRPATNKEIAHGEPEMALPRSTPQASTSSPVSLSGVEAWSLVPFDEWSVKYLKAAEEEKARLIEEGVKLAQARRPVFKALIMENPREAIQKAVPMVVRQKLPPEIVSLLEKRMNHIGAIRVMQGVPLDPNDPPVPTYREVELQKGGTYRAYVYGEREKKLTWTAGCLCEWRGDGFGVRDQR